MTMRMIPMIQASAYRRFILERAKTHRLKTTGPRGVLKDCYNLGWNLRAGYSLGHIYFCVRA